MGYHFNADLAWGVLVYEIEEEPEGFEPYEDWADIPDFLDWEYGGDLSADWSDLSVVLKTSRLSQREGGTERIDLDRAMTAVEVFSDSDDFEKAVEWCDKHNIDWSQAQWLLIASAG